MLEIQMFPREQSSDTLPIMPPTTSLSDCLWLLGLSIVMGSVFFFLGWTAKARSIATLRFTNALSLAKPSHQVDPAVASDAIHGYSCSLVAFLICWLPWLAMIVGSIGVSLIRDAGFVIFPWAMLLPGVLFIAGALLAARLKLRRLSRDL